MPNCCFNDLTVVVADHVPASRSEHLLRDFYLKNCVGTIDELPASAKYAFLMRVRNTTAQRLLPTRGCTAPLPAELCEHIFAFAAEDNVTCVLQFAKSVPLPAEWSLDVATEAWGTKWDAQEPRVERSELKLKYSFWSAWSPPINWLLRTAATHEDLAFKLGYSDGGMDFSGTGLVIGSKIVSSAEGAFGRYHGTMYEEEWEEDTDEIVYGDEIVIDEAEWKRRENPEHARQNGVAICCADHPPPFESCALRMEEADSRR
jgi:hypothetical protein